MISLKIFFCKKHETAKYFKKIPKIFLAVILVTVFVSQGAAFLKRIGTREASVAPSFGLGSITLNITRGELKGVKALVNGEEAGGFSKNSLTLSLEEDSVIEIFNPNDKIVAVSIEPLYGVEFFETNEKKVCKKGLTYIGKAIICRE